MRKMVILLALVAAAFGVTGASAHNPRDEAHRDCTDPVQTDESSFIGICIQDVGFIYAGSNGEGGGEIAVDGAAEMGSSDEASDGDPTQWLDGYVLITADDEPDGNIYCAGNGSFEDGDQADDSIFLAGGDCLNPGAP